MVPLLRFIVTLVNGTVHGDYTLQPRSDLIDLISKDGFRGVIQRIGSDTIDPVQYDIQKRVVIQGMLDIFDLDTLILLFEKLTNDITQDDETWTVLGILYQYKNDYKNSLNAFKQAIKANPENIDARNTAIYIEKLMNGTSNGTEYLDFQDIGGPRDEKEESFFTFLAAKATYVIADILKIGVNLLPDSEAFQQKLKEVANKGLRELALGLKQQLFNQSIEIPSQITKLINQVEMDPCSIPKWEELCSGIVQHKKIIKNLLLSDIFLDMAEKANRSPLISPSKCILEMAVRVHPKEPTLWSALGMELMRRNEIDEANKILKKAQKLEKKR